MKKRIWSMNRLSLLFKSLCLCPCCFLCFESLSLASLGMWTSSCPSRPNLNITTPGKPFLVPCRPPFLSLLSVLLTLIRFFYVPDPILNILHVLTFMILTHLWGRYYYSPQFKDKEPEAYEIKQMSKGFVISHLMVLICFPVRPSYGATSSSQAGSWFYSSSITENNMSAETIYCMKKCCHSMH